MYHGALGTKGVGQTSGATEGSGLTEHISPHTSFTQLQGAQGKPRAVHIKSNVSFQIKSRCVVSVLWRSGASRVCLCLCTKDFAVRK